MKQELKQIKKYITKNWGSKCKDYSPFCAVCIVWSAFEVLEYASGINDKIIKRK